MPDPTDIPPYIPNREKDRGRGQGRGRGKPHHYHNNRSRQTNTVTTVEWLSDEVIAAGLKDSTVFLHDVRSGGSASRLRHNGPVARICRVDEWRVVVGGVHSVSPAPAPAPALYLEWLDVYVCANDEKLQMYDLRYPPTNTNPNPKGNKNYNYNRHTSTATAASTSTKPYLVFQDYSPVNITPEFDLSSELGILANGASPPWINYVPLYVERVDSACRTLMLTMIHLYTGVASDEHTIQLFSLRTGELVSSSPSPLSRYKYSKGISSLCFESGGEGGIQAPQTPGLLVCSGDGVDEWRW